MITQEQLEKFRKEWNKIYEELKKSGGWETKIIPLKIGREPKNNDGRTTCFWCGNKTKKVQGFSSAYDVCERCGK